MKTIKIPRHAKGPRPDIFPDEPAAERLYSMLLALVTEVAVVRERMDTIERVAASKGVLLRDEIENFEPSIEVREERERWRQAYMDKIFQVLSDEVEEQGAPPPSW